jgi:CrcB protein
MDPVLLVGIGGGLGSIFRFELSKLQPIRGIPTGTLLVNVIGSSAFSFIIFSLATTNEIYYLVGIGGLGGFTTFSTFSYETFRMLENHDYYTMSINMLLNIAGSLVGVYLGYMLVSP